MVRKAEETDLQRIAEIIIFGKRVAYRPIFQNDIVSFNELTVVGLYNELITNSDMWKNMILFDDGIIKAVVNYSGTDSEDTAELFEFYVEPFFRGQGIGRELLSKLFDELLSNYKRIVLWVIGDNVSARKFYEMNGFQRTGNERLIEGTDKLDIQYIKTF